MPREAGHDSGGGSFPAAQPRGRAQGRGASREWPKGEGGGGASDGASVLRMLPVRPSRPYCPKTKRARASQRTASSRMTALAKPFESAAKSWRRAITSQHAKFVQQHSPYASACESVPLVSYDPSRSMPFTWVVS